MLGLSLLINFNPSFPPGLVFSARNKVENPPHRAGPKRGLYSSYRPLDRTKSISATRSSFFVKTLPGGFGGPGGPPRIPGGVRGGRQALLEW